MSEIRRRARHIVPPILGATVVLYFGYHAIQGERGLVTRWRLTQQVAASDAELVELVKRRAELTNRVGRLRPESLDMDILDERARAILGLVGREEWVVIENRDEAGSAGGQESSNGDGEPRKAE